MDASHDYPAHPPMVEIDPVLVRANIDAVLLEIDNAMQELGEAPIVSQSSGQAGTIEDAVREAMELANAAVAETDDDDPSPSYIAYCLRTMRSLIANAEVDAEY